ncbi:restriction endonuclease subunit S [Rhizobium sp. 18055]|uniref:restriction endonuclease subunit S n=1 Tax=Rhizobium sp. 18055 TaxID=2681403 RepID=UPI0013596684|nr:restriction endonuclease subunit S [Rhizobium sp. 18055]
MSSNAITRTTKSDGKPAVTPKLRFPEFRDTEGWKLKSLQDASVPVVERVGQRKLTPVSISAGIGFVPQSEKFGRDISGNQYQLYTLVRDGDFVFNKGNSIKFPQGCVYLLQGWGQVAAPNVFICFRLKDGYSNGFFQNCFEQNQHGKQLKKDITSGARSNGLLNINKKTFFSIELQVPSLAEQQKIADCLSSVDELIAAQARKVDAIESHKKGLMQQLFPCEGETQPRFRFPGFEDDWNDGQLEALCVSVSSGKDQRKADGAFNLYGSTGIIGKTERPSYNAPHILVARVGANAGHLTRATGQFGVTDNTLVINLKPAVNMDFIFYYLENININKLIFGSGQPLITGTILKNLQIVVPDALEQQRIANCLISLDALIAAQTKKLDSLKSHRKGLRQQLFPSQDEVEA